MRLSNLLATTVFLATSFPLAAQTAPGTPAFRVPIGGSEAPSGGPATYAWMQNVGTCSSTCGTGTRTTSYQCQDVASYDYAGAGYGAPEADSYCSSASARPSSTTGSCTSYSGCSYDWVKPAVAVTISPKPNPSGGSFPAGAVNDCSYAKRTFSPYCQRTGSPSVTMASGDYAFCKNDLPDYADVAAGKPDALGYDRTGDVESGCVVGSRDNEWTPGAWGANDTTCSTTPTQTRLVTCTRRFNGASLQDASCAGVSKPATTRTVAADYSSCSYAWLAGGWSPYSSNCSNSATRTRTVTCRRSNGDDVPDASCTGTKPATSETGSNLTQCTYAPRDQGRSACSAQGQQSQYWDCTRSDGTTGFPASYCGKTNPEALSCTPPPPTYTYSPQYRGESACSNGTKQVYWDCTRNDGVTGFPASQCGKTNPETQGCVSYTPRYQGESACSNGTKQVYWNCAGSDGSSAPAAQCGKTNPEAQTCTSYTWVADGWSGYNSGCSSSATRTRGVYCRGSDGQNYPDANCASQGAKPPSSETTPIYSSCTYASEDVSSSGCVSGTKTYNTQCRRSDGNIVANSNCGSSGTRTESCSSAPANCAASVDTIAISYAGNNVSSSRQGHVETYNVVNGSQARAINPGAYGTFQITNNGETRSFGFNYRSAAAGSSLWTGVVGGYTYTFRVGIMDSSYRLAVADVICQ